MKTENTQGKSVTELVNVDEFTADLRRFSAQVVSLLPALITPEIRDSKEYDSPAFQEAVRLAACKASVILVAARDAAIAGFADGFCRPEDITMLTRKGFDAGSRYPTYCPDDMDADGPPSQDGKAKRD